MEVKEPSAKYLAKPAYKQTEVGLIPWDWEVHAAGGIGWVRGGNGFPLAFQGEASAEYPFFKVSDMNTKGNETTMTVANNYISESTRRRLGATAFPSNTIVFAKVGAAVFLERKKVLGVPSCIDNNMAGLVVSYPGVDHRFIHYFLLAFRLSSLVSTTALPSLSGSVLKAIKIPLPPTIAEQQAIAEALSDADALIESLEQLLAKKRQIKQGAMQELLTAQKRLSGFAGEWKHKLIGEFTDCTAGGTPGTNMAEYWGGSIRWMNSGELNLKTVTEVEGRITEEGLRNSSTKLIPAGCVLIGLAGQGKTRGTVAMNLISLCTNQSIAAIFPNESFDTKYLYYNLDNRYDELRELSAGDGGRGGLNLTIIRSLVVPFPSIPEQTAIATFLSDMDAELTALEAKLAKARQIKQGMMQELLTGRIRLV